jgi:hypothetical protein
MEENILNYSNTLFALAKKAQLLTKEDLQDVFSDRMTKQIVSGLERDKANFIKNNPGISDPDGLWNNGVANRIAEDVSMWFMDYLEETKRAFAIDWDQPIEDIIFNFKNIFSDLDIHDLGETRIAGDWYQGMRIGSEIFQYKASDEGYVPVVITEINNHLRSLSKVLVYAKTGDDNQFTIIPLNTLPEFEKLGFFEA